MKSITRCCQTNSPVCVAGEKQFADALNPERFDIEIVQPGETRVTDRLSRSD